MAYPTQNHIHLDLPENTGGAPENAPLATYTVTDWSPDIHTIASFDRAWDGTSYFGSIVDGSGNPRHFVNMRYTLRVTQDQYDTLESLLLNAVNLVNIRHPDDGDDHTDAIVSYRFMEMKYLKWHDPLLQWHDISILLLPT